MNESNKETNPWPTSSTINNGVENEEGSKKSPVTSASLSSTASTNSKPYGSYESSGFCRGSSTFGNRGRFPVSGRNRGRSSKTSSSFESTWKTGFESCDIDKSCEKQGSFGAETGSRQSVHDNDTIDFTRTLKLENRDLKPYGKGFGELDNTSGFGFSSEPGFDTEPILRKTSGFGDSGITSAFVSSSVVRQTSGFGTTYEVKTPTKGETSNGIDITPELRKNVGFSTAGSFAHDMDTHSPRKQRPRGNRNNRRSYERKQYCYICGSAEHLSKSCWSLSKSEKSDSKKNNNEFFDCYKYDDTKRESENGKSGKVDVLGEMLNDIDLRKTEQDSFSKKNTGPADGNSSFEQKKTEDPPYNSLSSFRREPEMHKDLISFDDRKTQHVFSNKQPKREDDKMYQSIETHRRIKTQSGEECEEWTFIRFPISLPPNVKIITAHMLPPPV